MKKRILALLMALVMVFSLAACGEKPEEKPNDDKPAVEDNNDGEDDKPAAKDPSDVKVALLIGYQGDMSFNDSAVRGIEKAEKDLGISAKIIEYGDESDKFEPTLLDTADTGYDIIIASSSFQEYFEQHAPSYKDTTFMMFDAEVDYSQGDLDNVYSIVYKANEASLVGGYLSAKLSDSGVLGFLGGVEAPIINDFLLGFIQGAQLANEDAKVAASYVGSYTDSSKGKELAFAMNNQKADMIFNVAGGAGVGLIEAAAEKDFYVLGVDSDQAMMYDAKGNTDFANVIPTSVMKNVDSSLYRALDLYLKGELKIGEAEYLGLKEDGVGIAVNKYYEEKVSDELKKEIDDLLEKIIAGEIEVDTAYGKSTEEIQKIKDSVRP